MFLCCNNHDQLRLRERLNLSDFERNLIGLGFGENRRIDREDLL